MYPLNCLTRLIHCSPNQKPQNYRGFTQSYRDIRNPAHNGLVGRSNGVWLEVTPAQGTRALVKWNTLYSWRRASAGVTLMAWRAGKRQARNALRARSAAAANRLRVAG